MAWIERPARRTLHAKHWVNDQTNEVFIHTGLAYLHYPSGGPDSAAHDTEINVAPVRIQNAQLDGWRVVQNGWHYALGQPGDKTTDGWVGFGGRQGQHWLLFRLARVGYLHWPTRAWDDLGGAPTYTRANLSQTPLEKTIGPTGATQTMRLGTVVTWADLWPALPQGQIDIRWRVEGKHLKEEIILNQAAREWITANRPPSTPANETWFGFVFQLDHDDIPRWLKGELLQDINGDFEDEGTDRIKLEDAQQRVLAFLPIGHAVSVRYDNAQGQPVRDHVTLRQRVWHDPDGDTYLIVGARVDQLAGLHAGDVLFDPTFTIAETNEDGMSGGATDTDEHVTPATHPDTVFLCGNNGGGNSDGGWIFRGTGIPQGATISSAKLTIITTFTSAALTIAVWGFAVDSPTDFNAADVHRISDHHTRTTATVSDNGAWAATHETPDIASIIQEIVDRPGFSGDLGLTERNTGGSGYAQVQDFTDSTVDAADLQVTIFEPPTDPVYVYPSYAKV
jgi:hypothetical protein